MRFFLSAHKRYIWMQNRTQIRTYYEYSIYLRDMCSVYIASHINHIIVYMAVAYTIRHTRKIIRQMPAYWLPFEALLHIRYYVKSRYRCICRRFCWCFFLHFLIFTFNLSVCFFSSFLLLLLSGEFLHPNTCVYSYILHTLNFIFCVRPYVCNFIHMIHRIVCIYSEFCSLLSLSRPFALDRVLMPEVYMCVCVWVSIDF